MDVAYLFCSKPNHHYINCGNNKQSHVTLLISVQHVFITSTTFSFYPHLMKPTSSTKCSAVISLLHQGYSLCQIESETGLGKSIIGRINKEMDGDKENSKGGHPFKLSSGDKRSIICQITSGGLDNAVSDVPGLAWVQSLGLGWASVGSGLLVLKPDPEPEVGPGLGLVGPEPRLRVQNPLKWMNLILLLLQNTLAFGSIIIF